MDVRGRRTRIGFGMGIGKSSDSHKYRGVVGGSRGGKIEVLLWNGGEPQMLKERKWRLEGKKRCNWEGP